MADDRFEVNSRDWWDWYFSGQWDLYDGRAQTRYFMQLVIDHLPEAEREWLRTSPRSVLDWGCAYGDGVDLLNRNFPVAVITGADFSVPAIQEAKKQYPHLNFLHSPEGNILDSFDAIITSNCLEHFNKPLEIAARHLESCRDLYIVLVPFNEWPRHESHLFTFDQTSFPDKLVGFERISSISIPTDPKVWPGAQLLTVYASERYVQQSCRTARKPLPLDLDK
jgi:SAM-dependent methyltransferase